MGLLDKILKEGKDALNEVLSDENIEKAGKLFDTIKEKVEEQGIDLKEVVNSFKEENNNTSDVKFEEKYLNEDEEDVPCKDKILNVLNNEFAQYQIKENVSPTTLGGQGKFMDYSIVVYENDKPKLIMMLIGKTTTSHREYRWSKEEALKNNIPFINFIKHYPNTSEYISDRLHKYL